MKPPSIIGKQKAPIHVVAVIACIALLSPSQARGQILDIVNILSAIESTITGLIGGALTDIRSLQTQVQTLSDQEVVWPVPRSYRPSPSSEAPSGAIADG